MPNTISNKNDLFSLFEEVFQDWAENGKVLTEMSDKARKKEAEKFLLSLPKFTPTEAWGNPESTGRKTINRIFSVIGGGASVEGKLAYLQRITDVNNRITSPRRVIASLIMLEALAAIISDFNEASAGYNPRWIYWSYEFVFFRPRGLRTRRPAQTGPGGQNLAFQRFDPMILCSFLL